jgi:hypothetical protein
MRNRPKFAVVTSYLVVENADSYIRFLKRGLVE